jgi:hypothetical protein
MPRQESAASQGFRIVRAQVSVHGDFDGLGRRIVHGPMVPGARRLQGEGQAFKTHEIGGFLR